MKHTARKVPTETLGPKAENEPGAVAIAKEELERTLNQKLERLDEEIRELQSRVANLKDQAKAEWAEKMAELDAKRKKAGRSSMRSDRTSRQPSRRPRRGRST